MGPLGEGVVLLVDLEGLCFELALASLTSNDAGTVKHWSPCNNHLMGSLSAAPPALI
jgi:hypothetical protein